LLAALALTASAVVVGAFAAESITLAPATGPEAAILAHWQAAAAAPSLFNFLRIHLEQV